MKIEKIHFSIDDVILSLKWLKDNNPNSIFEMDFFKTLKRWNKRYGLQTSLYIYEMCDGFSIEKLPQKYWDELRENTSWLKFCWHRRKAGLLEDDYSTEIESFNRVKNIICNNVCTDAWTNTVRLHRYEASSELIKYLNEYGDIKCLLCADEDDRLSYDLDIKETNYLINKGIFLKKGMTYQKTDIRLDYLDIEGNTIVETFLIKTEDVLKNMSSDKALVLFCHEWRFNLICDYIEEYFQGLLNTMLYPNVQ